MTVCRCDGGRLLCGSPKAGAGRFESTAYPTQPARPTTT
jgi:hypothetical protein